MILLDGYLYQITETVHQINKQAYATYLPLVEDVSRRKVTKEELEHLLDYLLDFVCDNKMLDLYKRVCKNYLETYPDCIKFYIEAYREMWWDEEE